MLSEVSEIVTGLILSAFICLQCRQLQKSSLPCFTFTVSTGNSALLENKLLLKQMPAS